MSVKPKFGSAYDAWSKEWDAIQAAQQAVNTRTRENNERLRAAQKVCQHKMRDAGGGAFGYNECELCGETDL